jgi:hypothetical protein
MPAGAGDVNGDGLADLIVGAYGADPGGRAGAGRSYVIFGRTASTAVELSAVATGQGGFVIDGGSAGDASGYGVSGLGDVNGDGRADLSVAAPNAGPGDAGQVYVLFGGFSGAQVALSAVGAGQAGFVIDGVGPSALGIYTFGAAGDFNGDGLADVLVSAHSSDTAAGTDAGAAYVVFGKTDAGAVSLQAVASGSGGLAFYGAQASGYTGWGLGQAGDINGDGFGDIVLGSLPASGLPEPAGRIHVVFGRSAGGPAIHLSAVGADGQGLGGGFVIEPVPGETPGRVVAAAGDVNGDGLGDLIVDSVGADPAAGANAGRGYVVFGRTGSSAVQLSEVALGAGGFAIEGHCAGDLTGRGIAALGDVNGDGFADLLVGANLGDPEGRTNAGRAYVLFGGSRFATTVDRLGDASANSLVGTAADETLVAGAGNDTLIGGGGADVMMGGAGDDVFVLTTANSAALRSDLSGGQLARVVGGSGVDTLRLDGAGHVLDLTAIANVGAGTVGGFSRLEGIEKIDLTGSGANVLRLASADIVDLSGLNVFNDATAGGAGLGASVQRHQLWVDGNAGDLLIVTDGAWTLRADLLASGGQSYRVFDAAGSAAQLIVDTDVALRLSTLSPAVSLSAVAAGSGGFVINGECAGDESGWSVQNAGDVNGDGFDDLIVGARHADPAGLSAAGKSYVVFGGSAPAAVIELSAVAAGSGGFEIVGGTAGDIAGASVAPAGDVNGDGLADVIVGAVNADPAAGTGAGRSYVVYGRTATTPVLLSAVLGGNGGFVVEGESAGDGAGVTVHGAGDVNGDGYADIVIGAFSADPAAGSSAGRAYVVFGGSALSGVSLSAVAAGQGGFVVNGQCAGDLAGAPVSAAGDVNGDGLADLLVGAGPADPVAGTSAGRAYVVFGRTAATPVDLSAVAAGIGGFVVNGASAGDESGTYLSGLGDVNGDGLADFAVSAPGSDPAGATSAGRAYVVFGKSANTLAVALSAVAAGVGGYAIQGVCAGDELGFRISGAGDINGDGLGDLIVSAPKADPASGADAGRSWVVYGRAGNGAAAVQLSAVALGSGGFVIEGQCAGDASGSYVSGAGDLNGDGFDDLVVGAYQGDPSGTRADAGRSYVIFGGNRFATTVDFLGGVAADTLTGTAWGETFVGGAGNDTLTGGGGADVMFGGAGRDVFVLGASNLTALRAAPAEGQIARVDGGGLDTLRLSGSGLTLDLTAIANVSGAGPDGGSRIDSVEIVDLTGSGPNALVLATRDVIDMAGMNQFNDGGAGGFGIASGSLGATVRRHQVLVQGDAGDTLTVRDGTWSQATSIVGSDGQTYSVYDNVLSAAQLIVDADVAVTLTRAVPAVQLSTVAGGTGGFVINGQAPGDYSGWSVSLAGDVNGDGLDDVVVGAQNGDPLAGQNAGRTYVVFGRTGSTAVDLSAVAAGTGGFVIDGQAVSDISGRSVSGAGDVNGDGLADVIVGARDGDPAAGGNAGRSYVVFGRTATAAVSLSAVAAGSGGFVINGQCSGDMSGENVSSAGDVNGDGLSDLIVGALGAASLAGRSYVVYGRTALGAVDLSAVAAGSGGFVIHGQCAGDRSSHPVSGAGDVNGDGLADLIVGARYASPSAGVGAGRSYVVFGSTGSTAVSLSAVAAGSGGFVINGQCLADESGAGVSAAGDVNGDGLADLIVGSPRVDTSAGSDSGRYYVVFGRTAQGAVDLSVVAGGSGGFAINGQCAGDIGEAVSSAGDVNGDGLSDLIIGARFSDPAAGTNGGRSYVVYGRTGTGAVDLSAVAAGVGGFVLEGQGESDQSGFSVSAAGDVNGDGFADLLVGAPNADPAAGTWAGRTYVVFGGDSFATMVDFVGGSGNDTLNGPSGTTLNLSETFAGGAGNDTVYGGGGADVMYGGAGNDVFVLNADNVARLSQGLVDGQLARVDGGSGIDTLALDGGGLNVDFTQISAVGASTPGSSSRIEGIEKIDLTGSGNNTLKISAVDVLDMSGFNTFNVDGNAAVADALHQLMVTGNAGDSVQFADPGWVNTGTWVDAGVTYQVWTDEQQRAQALVSQIVSVIGGS